MSRGQKSISHYKVVEELGRGGMGIVYKCEDTKLNRPVALKILSPHLLSSEDDRLRFYREARSAAQLNHPNIAIVHAVDETVDETGHPQPFIAMEYIDGKTLRELIDKGPIRLKEAIRITCEIASALRHAHERNTVHRDVKSGNIMLTEDGAVKVLDFGLAKTAQSIMVTAVGTTLGTPAYMSPEQTLSSDVDRRTDLWSLGVVLYEMVAGKLPFGGAYEQAVVYSILNEDPEPLTSVRSNVPIELDRIVAKCLMKDPELRYQHADDLIVDLAAMQLGMSTAQASSPRTVGAGSALRTTSRRVVSTARAAVMAAAALLIGIVGGWALMQFLPTPPRTVLRVSITLPKGVSLSRGETAPLQIPRRVVALSPDATSLVFVGKDSSGTRLYHRHLDDFESHPLVGTDGAYGPYFSTDGHWVAFYASGQLKKVSIDGGPPIILGPVSLPVLGAWGPDGNIILANNVGRSLVQINSNGGSPVPVDLGEIHRVFDILDDGTLVGTTFSGEIVIKPSGSSTALSTGVFGESPFVVKKNRLLFGNMGDLYSVPLNPSTFKPTGNRTRVVDRVWYDGRHQFSVSHDGSIAFVRGPSSITVRLSWIDRSGNKDPLGFEPQVYHNFKISPDGSQIAISWMGSDGEENIWIVDAERETYARLSHGGVNRYPIWTADGLEVIYRNCNGNDCRIQASRVGTSSGTRTIAETSARPAALTPDGKMLLASGPTSILRIRLDEKDGAVDTLVTSGGAVLDPAVSPDGRFMGYTADVTRQFEIWVEPLPQTGQRWQASVGGGEEVSWSQDGTELYYRYGNRLYAVALTKLNDSIEFGPPTVLYEGPLKNIAGVSYDIAPDGRFLIVESAEQPDDLEHIHFISKEWLETDG